MSVVSAVTCQTYNLDELRAAVQAVLAPLGGLERFVRPGMMVLLKPNLLSDAPLERAVTTHPAVVQAVAGLVQAAGGSILIGDSPAGSVDRAAVVYRTSGMAEVAAQTGAQLVTFDSVTWKRLNSHDYYIARPVLAADLVINLPKLKTHSVTLYTGAVKNLFGVIPGTRKREVHYRAPGLPEFSQALADVLELVRPGLTIMDGVLGQEGNGPGVGGTPRQYACLVASPDPVALDAVVTQAMGYRPGEVLHLTQAGGRGLGVCDPGAIAVAGEPQALRFGPVRRPKTHWFLRAMPAWAGAPLYWAMQLRPGVTRAICVGCGRCVEVCPRDAITPGRPPTIDLGACVGCLCCAEVCPHGAIAPRRNLIARLTSAGATQALRRLVNVKVPW